MGFYFRKSKGILGGLFRLNFSKKGIGVSTGVKGARFVVGPAGTYVHLGRKGFYYKKYLGKNTFKKSKADDKENNLVQPQYSGSDQKIDSTLTTQNFDNLSDGTFEEFLNELNTKRKKFAFQKIFGTYLSIILFVFILYKIVEVTDKIIEKGVFVETKHAGINLRKTPAKQKGNILRKTEKGEEFKVLSQDKNSRWAQILGHNGDTLFVHKSVVIEKEKVISKTIVRRLDEYPSVRYIVLTGSAGGLIFWTLFLGRMDRKRKSTFITYELDDDMLKKEQELQEIFRKLKQNRKIWQITSESRASDSKYNAGATINVKRNSSVGVSLDSDPDKYFETNVKIPCLSLLTMSMYFLPDRILLKRNGKYAAVEYDSLDIVDFTVSFRESESVPRDATVEGHTWLYVNKSGGPDRRFNNNKKIPICAYGQYELSTEEGVKATIMTSRKGGFDEFVDYVYKTEKSVQDIDNQSKTTPNASNNEEVFSKEYLKLMLEFGSSLINTKYKLFESNNYQKLKSEIPFLSDDKNEGVRNLIRYDMYQLVQQLSDGELDRSSLEFFGFILLSDFIEGADEAFLLNDHSILQHNYNDLKSEVSPFSKLGDTAVRLCKLYEEAFEVLNAGSVMKHRRINFFANYIRRIDNELYTEYATTLYRFSNVIAKADGVVTKHEETALKNIYTFLHNEIDLPETIENVSEEPNPFSEEKLEDVLAELEEQVGLESVKSEIKTLINAVQIQEERRKMGLKIAEVSNHLVFTGSPGTGKTTIARLIARVYKALGIVKSGHLVEVDRSKLIAEYVGQTANKVDEVIDSALDGVLFIDEAYSLVSDLKGDYGPEAIATILKRMEDDRERLVVIVAGYPNEMNDFISSNPGLKSRFNRYIHFEDYSSDELLEIFKLFARKADYKLSAGAEEALRIKLIETVMQKNKDFGNGRVVRNLFEKCIEMQSNRIAGLATLTKDVLTEIHREDIPE